MDLTCSVCKMFYGVFSTIEKSVRSNNLTVSSGRRFNLEHKNEDDIVQDLARARAINLSTMDKENA